MESDSNRHECLPGSGALLDAETAKQIAREMVDLFCPFQYSPMAQSEQPDFNHPVFRAHERLIKRLTNRAPNS